MSIGDVCVDVHTYVSIAGGVWMYVHMCEHWWCVYVCVNIGSVYVSKV